MDPFNAEGELVNIHTAFIQGQYETVLSDFEPSSFSDSNRLSVQILHYRAQCALGRSDEVLASISDSDAKSNPDLAAARIYAQFHHDPSDSVLQQAEALVAQHEDNLTVQLLCGTVLAGTGQEEAAIALLGNHEGSLDAAALLVQIHLMLNRPDLAAKEAKSARAFAQDALLVNLAESWVGLRQGGENYQKAFYVFEELAQAPSSTAATSLIAQAVSELHLGRIEEAESALNQALTLQPQNPAALANKVVLDTIAGRDSADARAKLEAADTEHEQLRDLAAKKLAFQEAMSRYTPKFEV